MNQEKLWDKIAPEWDDYKKIPAQTTKNFLEKASGKILDLGSGSGRNIKKIPNGKMFLVDFSKEMLKFAEKKAKKLKINIETKQGNLFKIPYEDNFFDFCISISALHCIKPNKHKKSAQELYRVMKPKSKSLIGVWNVNSKRFSKKDKEKKEKLIKWTDKGERYYYLFEEKEVHKLFKDAGFKIISSHNSEMMINFVLEK
jgi:ubiquinone/menaquinone biosynthesis C-methylase UbiE